MVLTDQNDCFPLIPFSFCNIFQAPGGNGNNAWGAAASAGSIMFGYLGLMLVLGWNEASWRKL